MMVWEYFTHFHKSALCYTDVHVYRATSLRVNYQKQSCEIHVDQTCKLTDIVKHFHGFLLASEQCEIKQK